MCAICLQNGLDPLTAHPQSDSVPWDTCKECRRKFSDWATSELVGQQCFACRRGIELHGLATFRWRKKLQANGFLTD